MKTKIMQSFDLQDFVCFDINICSGDGIADEHLMNILELLDRITNGEQEYDNNEKKRTMKWLPKGKRL